MLKDERDLENSQCHVGVPGRGPPREQSPSYIGNNQERFVLIKVENEKSTGWVWRNWQGHL